MSGIERLERVVLLAGGLTLSLGIIACGSKSPSGPSSNGAIASVSLSAASVGTGGSVQGTVTLGAAAASGGVAVALSSSNTAVATVQTPITVPAGASSAGFTVKGVAPGSATITASLNGSTQSSTITVTSGVALASLTVNTTSIIGGSSATGTATLTGPAPADGAVVTLTSSDPVSVPATVTVPGGSASTTFRVTTRSVGGTTSATISGSYGGASASATLSVTRPTTAVANFGVTGPNETETCTLINNGNTINCTFNGSTSVAPGTITAWDWSYGVAKTFAQTTSSAVLTDPTVDCSILPPPPFPAGVTWFTMTVKLTIHDSLGNTSAEAVDNGVRLFPQGTCGY